MNTKKENYAIKTINSISFHPEANCEHKFIHVIRKGFLREQLEVYCKKCGWRRNERRKR